MNQTWHHLITTGRIMRQAFREQQDAIRDVYGRMAPYLCSPAGTPAAFAVRPGAVPGSFYAWHRNLFSTLFHSAYLLLDCEPARRHLYGRLIHLYRIWVTSADNLLDDEDKQVVPIDMCGSSRVMRQVVAIMAADRVLGDILQDAVADGVVQTDVASALQRESLCRLLPSAAEEASEEGGIGVRPDPGYVLDVIHRLKTGLLFNIAFAGPEIAETHLDPGRLSDIKEDLMQFGLGCQVLDDIRDLGRDLRDGRHNYLLSWLAHGQPDTLEALQARALDGADRLYLEVPRCTSMAAEKGLGMMRAGLAGLGRAGLEIDAGAAGDMADFMFSVLDLRGCGHAA